MWQANRGWQWHGYCLGGLADVHMQANQMSPCPDNATPATQSAGVWVAVAARVTALRRKWRLLELLPRP